MVDVDRARVLTACLLCADDASDEEGDGDRVDQQMGDAGDAAEDVDERLWNGDEEEDGAKNKVRSWTPFSMLGPLPLQQCIGRLPPVLGFDCCSRRRGTTATPR